jgi:hypothetical protein
MALRRARHRVVATQGNAIAWLAGAGIAKRPPAARKSWDGGGQGSLPHCRRLAEGAGPWQVGPPGMKVTGLLSDKESKIRRVEGSYRRERTKPVSPKRAVRARGHRRTAPGYEPATHRIRGGKGLKGLRELQESRMDSSVFWRACRLARHSICTSHACC